MGKIVDELGGGGVGVAVRGCGYLLWVEKKKLGWVKKLFFGFFQKKKKIAEMGDV